MTGDAGHPDGDDSVVYHQAMTLLMIGILGAFGLYIDIPVETAVFVGLICAAIWVAWMLRTEYSGGEERV